MATEDNEAIRATPASKAPVLNELVKTSEVLIVSGTVVTVER